MLLSITMTDSEPQTVNVIMPGKTRDRLATTCFRGKGTPLAGNFLSWENVWQILNNRLVQTEFSRQLGEQFAKEKPSSFVWRFSMSLPFIVGWSSTEPRRLFQKEYLEPFALNSECIGLRLRDYLKQYISAPQTTDLTMVLRLVRMDNHHWNAFVETIYPGEDIGPLRSPDRTIFNITDRSGCVFFDWTFPGDTDDLDHHLMPLSQAML